MIVRVLLEGTGAGNRTSIKVRYVVTEAGDDDEAVRQAVIDAAEPSHAGLPLDLDSVEVDPVDDTTWFAEATYKLPEASSKQDGEGGEGPDFNFDTTGQTMHITQSLATVGMYGQFPLDYEKAIGVTDKAVEGVDITVPTFKWTERHYFSPASMTPQFMGQIFHLTGCVNAAPFRFCLAGEALFLGATGTERKGLCEVTFNFAGSPNKTDFKVGSIDVASKKGWEYMWVRYEDTEGEKDIIKKPSSVYVEKVYEDGDFSELQIGS
jgi:hypothetical protein